jgi:hypothetical protein
MSVTCKPHLLNVVMLSVVMLSVVAPFVPGRPCQLSLMFVSKAGILLWCGPPERCFTRVGSGLISQH